MDKLLRAGLAQTYIEISYTVNASATELEKIPHPFFVSSSSTVTALRVLPARKSDEIGFRPLHVPSLDFAMPYEQKCVPNYNSHPETANQIRVNTTYTVYTLLAACLRNDVSVLIDAYTSCSVPDLLLNC